MNKFTRISVVVSIVLLSMLLFGAVVSAAGGASRAPFMENEGRAESMAASIVMTKTVSAGTGSCSTSSSLTVLPGSTVTYCFDVTNTGSVTLTSQTLLDSHLGQLLSGAAITLTPGGGTTFSTTALITRSVVNTATWTASDVLSNTAQFTDTASVAVFTPTIALTKTVSLSPGACGTGSSLTVIPGQNVLYCYKVTNTGVVTAAAHTLVDDALGTLLNAFSLTLPPGASYTYSTTAQVTQPVTNTATWTVDDGFGNLGSAIDSASVDIFNPGIALTKTVSATPGICGTGSATTVVPGESATYCYEVSNTGLVTVTSHTLTDDVLGALLTSFPLTLTPGASYTYSTTIVVTDAVTNTATWAADDGFGNLAVAVDSAFVDTFDPLITLSKTANTTPGSCPGSDSNQIIPGTNVNYCFAITNTGPVTLTSHTLTDDQLGLLFFDQSIVVPPAATYTFSTTAVVTQSVTNVGIWTADDGYGHLAVDNDSTSVTVLMPSIVMTKTVSDVPGICAPTQTVTVTAGSSVTYCYEILNTSQVTVTSHTLVDDQLGTLLSGSPAVVGPGQTFTYSTTVPINVDTVNTATWTAQEPFGNQAVSVDSASVLVTTPGIDLEKTVRSGTGACPGTPMVNVVPGTLVQYCFDLQNTGTTTFTTSTLVDDQLGTILNNAAIVIPPGGNTIVTATAVITQPTTNLATWTATDIFSNQLQASDIAVAGITGVSVSLQKTVSAIAGQCAPTSNISVVAGTTVTYCFTITNTGQITLTSHTLVDNQLGLLLNGAQAVVGPGQTYTYSTTVVINNSVTNNGTWTAIDMYANSAVDSDTATVTVVAAGILVSPGSLFSSQAVSQVVTATLYITNTGALSLNWSIEENQTPASGSGESPAALGDEIFRLDLGADLGNGVLVGVEYDGSSFWVTAGGITNDPAEPNLLYQFDSSGQLMNVYTQTTAAAGFGWRDLAYDGSFLYASDSGVIEEIDPADGQPTGTTFPSPQIPARALAYDPATDHFWVANFGSPIYEISRSGQIINTFANNVGSIYGLGWDDASPGGPFLWAWTTDAPPNAVQIDPSTGQPTGVSFTGAANPGGSGGGATITADLYPDKLVLIALHQAVSDTVVGYDLAVSTGQCPVNDLGWLSVTPASGVIGSGGSAQVSVIFDSNAVPPGFYQGNLCVTSSDLQDPLIVVPVQMIAGFDNKIYIPLVHQDQ